MTIIVRYLKNLNKLRNILLIILIRNTGSSKYVEILAIIQDFKNAVTFRMSYWINQNGIQNICQIYFVYKDEVMNLKNK